MENNNCFECGSTNTYISPNGYDSVQVCKDCNAEEQIDALTASLKHPQIERMLSNLTGVSRVGAVSERSCVTCSGEAKNFRDALSRKEYTISGMCQKCQDSVFGVEEA